MLPVRIILQNYRCFSGEHPFDFVLAPGITAIVGPNNAGKTSALYALRDVGVLLGEFLSSNATVTVNADVPMQANERWFFHGNVDPMQLEVSSVGDAVAARSVQKIDATFTRAGRRRVRVWLDNAVELHGTYQIEHGTYREQTAPSAVATDRHVGPAAGSLHRRVIIPSFRTPLTSATGTVLDFPIGQSLVTQWTEWKGGDSITQNRAAADIEEDIRRIFGFRSLSIATRTQNSGFRLVIDGNYLNLDEVGSGVAHVMMTLMATALTKPDWVLIDEPETGMHPTLQVEYLTAVRKHCKTGIVIATHSLGLARTVADRIYGVRRVANAEGTISSTMEPYGARGTYAELLGAVGYAAYKQSGNNVVLWVEGPHDVMVFRSWYRQLGGTRTPLILPLYGDNGINERGPEVITQIQQSLDARIYAVIDSERQGPDQQPSDQRRTFQTVLQRHGAKCLITERCATENYFTASAIQCIGGPEARALTEFERHNAQRCGFDKADGARIASLMTRDDIQHTDIGRFLLQLIAETQ